MISLEQFFAKLLKRTIIIHIWQKKNNEKMYIKIIEYRILKEVLNTRVLYSKKWLHFS